MGLSPMIPGFVAIGAAVFAIIALGLWANDAHVKQVFRGANLLSNCEQLSSTACVFYSSYPVVIAGTAIVIIGALWAIISGLVMKGDNRCFRVLAFVFLLIGAIFSVSGGVLFLVSYWDIFNGISLNSYGRAMLAFAFLSFAAALATAIMTCVARD